MILKDRSNMPSRKEKCYVSALRSYTMLVPTMRSLGTFQIIYIMPLFQLQVEISIPMLENISYKTLKRTRSIGRHLMTTHYPSQERKHPLY